MKTISICAKCSDMFNAVLSENSEVLGEYNGYVLPFFTSNEDYIELEIDITTGTILNWIPPTKKQLEIFQNVLTN
jgi:hypothetical protein